MEDGEIPPELGSEHYPAYGFADTRNIADPLGTIHSPSIEWPGDTDDSSDLVSAGGSQAPLGLPTPSSSLRLLVQRSPVLRRHRKLALLDGYTEVQIGRDLAPACSDTPRIRLKEMEVSKLHATIFWDQDRAHWSVVDMGSKHGTFVRSAAALTPATSAAAAGGVDEKGFRLSAPRIASMPRTLHHFDRLTIGGTTFLAHIHEHSAPCSSCSPHADGEIPLFLHRTVDGDAGASKRRKVTDLGVDPCTKPGQQHDPKQTLAALKRSLLSSMVPALSSPDLRTQQYVDRSARRRAFHPDHSPGTTSSSERLGVASSSSMPSLPISGRTVPTPPPAPLTSTNIGHRLLTKQGWQPGTALGEPSNGHPGLVAPLEPPSTVGRAGIGAPVRSDMQDGASWRDAGRKRRWDEIRNSGNVP